MAFKIRLNEQSIINAQSGFTETIKKVLNNKTMLGEIGDVIINDVKLNTRLGKSIPTGGKLKPLKDSWIKQRKKISQATKVHDTFSPARSNLTLTGQLLDSMRKVFKGMGSLEIKFFGNHQPYFIKTKSGTSRIGKAIPNEKLAGYVAEGGRPFFGIRKQVKSRINIIVRSYLRRAGKLAGFL